MSCLGFWPNILAQMSKNDPDSEQSYCSDDSEFNYIPGPCVIEAVEDEGANANEAATSPTDDTLDPDTFKPYEDEPMASEEWVSEYEKRQETQADFERKLQDRYERNTICEFVVSVCRVLPLVIVMPFHVHVIRTMSFLYV